MVTNDINWSILALSGFTIFMFVIYSIFAERFIHHYLIYPIKKLTKLIDNPLKPMEEE